ncbi:MAG: LPS export ABC transporter periplasmic protein LptC [Sterolibacterium sp.]|nr:LPS export ABC transporter periplasmic protein LptC [Sterolibacterium sp.]
MRISLAPLLPLVLLALLAGGTFWLERASRLDEGTNDGKLRHDPDFVVDNFTTRRFDLEGRLQHTLRAARMLHYPDDDTTEVTTPQVVYALRNPPLYLNARQAWISPEGKEVRLVDDVRMVRAAGINQAELVMETAELHVYPDEETARANTPVTLLQGGSRLHGSGLEANNLTQKFMLLGRVHGSLQPRH